jgi:hypothetical protein
MKTAKKLWVVEAHDLGALQMRAVEDAVALNKKKWLAGEKADRMLLGVGETIEEALEVERELKRERRTGNPDDRRRTADNGQEKSEVREQEEQGGYGHDNRERTTGVSGIDQRDSGTGGSGLPVTESKGDNSEWPDPQGY